MCIFGPVLATGQQRAPFYNVNFGPAEVYPAGGETPGQGVRPYGLAIADVVGPPPDYLPDGLPDVAVALYETENAPAGFSGRVVIFRNTGDWADDGQNNGLVFFAQIDFPVYWAQGLNKPRPPYDLKWVDMDRDPPHYDLDLVVVTGGINLNDAPTPHAGVWVIRNNCTSDPNDRFELLFDSNQNWPYPIDFDSVGFPGLDVDELNGDALPDVACGGRDPRPPPPPEGTQGLAAVHVFRNKGGLELDDQVVTIVSNAALPVAFGSAVVSRRTRFDPDLPTPTPLAPQADVMMSLKPEGGQDGTLVVHPDGTGGFASQLQDGIRGYGLALQEFRPCELALVSTFFNSNIAKARVMFLDTGGDIINVPMPINYLLQFDLSPPSRAWGVATGRFDSDGLWEFVVAFGGSGPFLHVGGGVAVFRNDPANPGQFLTSPSYFNTDPTWQANDPLPGPTFVVVADMDHDRRPDLIVTNTGSNEISVLINATGGW